MKFVFRHTIPSLRTLLLPLTLPLAPHIPHPHTPPPLTPLANLHLTFLTSHTSPVTNLHVTSLTLLLFSHPSPLTSLTPLTPPPSQSSPSVASAADSTNPRTSSRRKRASKYFTVSCTSWRYRKAESFGEVNFVRMV